MPPLDTPVRLLYDACRQSGRDDYGANCRTCTLNDICEGQLQRAGRERDAIALRADLQDFRQGARGTFGQWEHGGMAAELNLSKWSDAEVLDVPMPDGLLLRAIVGQLATTRWQWSVMAVDGDRSKMISIGDENDATAARSTAISEIEKCVRDD